MTTIDHRILIPVPQHVVWDYVGKLAYNTKWQADCKSIAFISSRQEGVGTRFRYASDNGKEYVAEIKAWYDGLGYEYVYVERPPFRSASSRIRLQEIAEGTIVQWTFTYEAGGVFGGVRSARHIDHAIAQSLKKLYLQLKTDRARILDPHAETKALMRDAPDVDERAQYQPRHPTASLKPVDPSKPLKPVVLPGEEPPAEEGDTRPTRSVAAITSDQAVLREPDFLADLPHDAPTTSKRDTAEHKRVGTTPGSSAAASSDAPVPEDLSHAQRIDIGAIAHELAGSTEPAPPIIDLPATGPMPAVKPGKIIEEPPPATSDSQRFMDTSKISIWEVFGVPRPSESQIITPVQDTPPPARPKTPAKRVPAPPPVQAHALPAEPPVLRLNDVSLIPPRMGMRRALRRKSALTKKDE